MKRGETKSIAELVRAMCREEGLETPLNEYRIMNAWGEVLGAAVQSYTKELRIYNQVLYVTLTSSRTVYEPQVDSAQAQRLCEGTGDNRHHTAMIFLVRVNLSSLRWLPF